MKIDIPTPNQIKFMIKAEVDNVIKALKQENMVLRRRLRGLEEAVEVLSNRKEKKMSEL